MELLSYFFVGFPFVVSLLLAVAVIVLIWVLAHSPAWGAGLVLGYASIEALFVATPPINLGVNIFLGDLVSVSLGIALLLRVGDLPWRSAIARLWVVFGIFLLLSLALGMARYKAAAASDFRVSFFYAWIAIAYFMSFELTEAQLVRIGTLFTVAALFLLLLAGVRWMAEANSVRLGSIGVVFPDNNYFRVVGAGQALTISIGALFLLQRWLLRKAGFATLAMVGVLLLAVAVLQHRSVWAAASVGLMALVALQRRQLGRRTGPVLLIPMVGVALMALVLVLGGGQAVQQSVGRSAQEVAGERSTFTGRTEGWRSLLIEWSAGGFKSYAIGQPFGSGYAREQQGVTVKWTPHNYYVQSLLRAGVLGALASLLAFVLAAYRLFRARKGEHAAWMPMYFALLVMELFYFIPYAAQIEHAIFCGVAFSIAARLKRQEATAASTRVRPRPLLTTLAANRG